jgi:hypothetical protein
VALLERFAGAQNREKHFFGGDRSIPRKNGVGLMAKPLESYIEIA